MNNKPKFYVYLYKHHLNVFLYQAITPVFQWNDFDIDEWNSFKVGDNLYDIHILFEDGKGWTISIYPTRNDPYGSIEVLVQNPCKIVAVGVETPEPKSLQDTEILELVYNIQNVLHQIERLSKKQKTEENRELILESLRVTRNRLRLSYDLMKGDKQ